MLNVAYPMAPVGPDAVGGAEQVLGALDGALVAGGHRSLVVACDGSRVAGTLFATPAPPEGAIDPDAIERHQRRTAERVEAVLRNEAVDVVHMHGIDFHRYLPPPGPPLLATLHLPPGWYPPEALCPPRPRSFVHPVSASQAAALPPGPQVLPFIPNGVPVAALGRHRPKRCSFALVLARICPEKGIHLALDAAKAAGSRLLLAGTVFPYKAHQDYFEAEVRPRLDRDRRYLGPVGFERKRRLLAAARCLLVPSLVAETSSLVAMEAASCGTPVIAFRNGALPEVVEEGRTGFLVDDVAGMATAMGRVGAIGAEACRAVARRRFSLEAMVERYLACYRDLVA